MGQPYVDSFLLLVTVTIVSVLFFIALYYFLGLLGEKRSISEQSDLKRSGYTGGKAISGRRPVFKTIFFQYAIYFLIFDVVAFVTALVGFSTLNWRVDWPFDMLQTGVHVLIYLSIILFLFLILPRTQEEVI